MLQSNHQRHSKSNDDTRSLLDKFCTASQDRNDNVPQFESNPIDVMVYENITEGDVIVTVSAYAAILLQENIIAFLIILTGKCC